MRGLPRLSGRDKRILAVNWTLWLVLFAAVVIVLVRQGRLDDSQNNVARLACVEVTVVLERQDAVLSYLDELTRAVAMSAASPGLRARARELLPYLRETLATKPEPCQGG